MAIISKTWMDIGYEVFTELERNASNDVFVDYVLWEHTTYPLGSVEHVTQQLREYRAENGSPYPIIIEPDLNEGDTEPIEDTE